MEGDNLETPLDAVVLTAIGGIIGGVVGVVTVEKEEAADRLLVSRFGIDGAALFTLGVVMQVIGAFVSVDSERCGRLARCSNSVCCTVAVM